eukprot:TRINITY_DN10707_c0_g1_i2.p1 TRINITY_DN10707_c0_g1~~TRINITY_DN10707_c0_g1_i2.p1  ORF type:complete len:1141 (-),score=231.97 TRINITY_DN10707_c0_g1_i2:109-3531(-)
MGAYLSLRLKWNPDDETELERVPANNKVFDRVLRKLEQTVKLQPKESTTHFARPLTFTSSLYPGRYDRFDNKADYVKDESNDTITSVSAAENGQPDFTLTPIDDVSYTATIRTVEHLVKHFKHFDQASDFHEEAYSLLEAHKEPLTNIAGLNGTPEQVLSKSYEQVQQLMDIGTQTSNNPQKENQVALANARRSFELLLVLNRLDNRLMAAAGAKTGDEDTAVKDKNAVHAIENEMRLLQSYCGHESSYCLVSINWESEYKFASGVRAPPWRQSYGELCYLVVGTHDVGKLVLTCSKDGIFVNKGYYIDDQGQEKLNYESNSETFPTITACLRSISPHFAAHIDHQEQTVVDPDGDDTESDEDPDLDVSDDEQAQQEDAAATAAANGKASTEPASERGASPRDGGSADAAGQESARSTRYDDEAAEEPASPSPRDTARSSKGNTTARSKKKPGTAGKGQSQLSQSGRLSNKWTMLQLDADNTMSSTQRSKPATTRKKKLASSRSAGTTRRRGKGKGRRDTVKEDSSTDEEFEEDIIIERSLEKSDISPDYTQINKLVKFLKTGTQRATIIALVALRDFNLKDVKNQLAVKDVGGLEPLINLLHPPASLVDSSASSMRLRLGAAILLRDVALNPECQVAIANLYGIEPLVDMLKDSSDQAKCLAAETLAHLSRNARNRVLIRKVGGIKALVGLLKAPKTRTDVSRSAALALWSCCRNEKNKAAVRDAGGIVPLVRLLDSYNEQLVIPVAGVIEELATDQRNRSDIRETDKTTNPPGAVCLLVQHLSSQKLELSTQAAAAIYRLAEDEHVRQLVHEYKGLETIASLLYNENPDTLQSATGAIWKLAASADNALVFNQLDVVPRLVELLQTGNEVIRINVAGAIWNCCKIQQNRASLRSAGGLPIIVSLLTSTHHDLLINITGALWAAAHDTDNMRIICQNDGLRLLWSLLKSANPKVQANAAGAIGPCMEDPQNVADVGRSFVGALSILIGLLSSEDEDVQANVCYAIAKIAQDEENLAVITEDGVLPLLAKLTVTKNDNVRKNLAYAIAECCSHGKNREVFGKLGAILPLVEFLKSQDPEVHRATACATEQLSSHPTNSIAMWNAGAVQLLMHMISSSDETLQEAAASTVSNIRKYHLTPV